MLRLKIACSFLACCGVGPTLLFGQTPQFGSGGITLLPEPPVNAVEAPLVPQPQPSSQTSAPRNTGAPGATWSQPPILEEGSVAGWNEGEVACDPCLVECPWYAPSRCYVGVDVLYWWLRGQRLPALVTTSPDGTPLGDAGVFGLPTTTTLLGAERASPESVPGGRLRIGFAPVANDRHWIDFEYFSLDQGTDRDVFQGPDGFSNLARPFFRTNADTTPTSQPLLPPVADAFTVAYPGILDGAIGTRTGTDLRGVGLWWRPNLIARYGDPSAANISRRYQLVRVDPMIGVRSLDLDEFVSIRQLGTFRDPNGTLPPGTTLDISDQFRTENEFTGADLGLSWFWLRNRWAISQVLRFGVGNLRQEATIGGSTVITSPVGVRQEFDSGFLALASNQGTFTRDQFTVLPEIDVRFHYQATRRMRWSVGHSLLIIPNVLRPGDMIDTSLDTRLVPPATVANGTNPAPQFREDTFWARGVTFGIEYQF